ncbi:MAG: internal scaffolding protein [Microviridae sp.]|nr:MAG: internal scaffolding protein [Microviridae sp.]
MRPAELVHILEGFDMSTKKCVFPRVLSGLNYDRAAWSDMHGLECKDPSLAVQSQKDEADINTIVRNFGVTGQLPQGVRIPSYGDFDSVDDYRTAIDAVRAAEASFLAMPSDLRARLGHDPARFVEWCADVGNLEEMRKLGLAVPAPVSDSGASA